MQGMKTQLIQLSTLLRLLDLAFWNYLGTWLLLTKMTCSFATCITEKLLLQSHCLNDVQMYIRTLIQLHSWSYLIVQICSSNIMQMILQLQVKSHN